MYVNVSILRQHGKTLTDAHNLKSYFNTPIDSSLSLKTKQTKQTKFPTHYIFFSRPHDNRLLCTQRSFPPLHKCQGFFAARKHDDPEAMLHCGGSRCPSASLSHTLTQQTSPRKLQPHVRHINSCVAPSLSHHTFFRNIHKSELFIAYRAVSPTITYPSTPRMQPYDTKSSAFYRVLQVPPNSILPPFATFKSLYCCCATFKSS